MTLLAVAAAFALASAPPPSDEVSLRSMDAPALAALRANDTRRLRLISVWATWCGPCVVELPDVAALEREWRGPRFELVTVSADEPERRDDALALLRRHQVAATNSIFTGPAHVLTETLDPSWNGGLPFALLVAPGGRVLLKSQGTLAIDRLRAAIRDWTPTTKP